MKISGLPTRAGAAAPARPQPWQPRQRQQRRQLVAPPAARKQGKGAGGKGFGKGASSPAAPAESPVEQRSEPATATAPVQAPSSSSSSSENAGGASSLQPPAATATAASPTGALPAVDRGRVLAVCAQVSVLVAAFGVGLRQLAPAISPTVKDGYGESVEALLNWATLPTASQLALAAAVAAGVTAARTALLAAWPDFKDASDRSNQQVLAPLAPADILLVAALPAVSEELLFRGALIPAIYPDWRGVLIAGLAFGVLHNSGGRNPVFAAWASAVGCAYGALFLATGSLACPALAHTLSNVASAALWKAAQAEAGGGSSSK